MSLGKMTRKKSQKLSAKVEPAMPAQAFTVATVPRMPIKKPTIRGSRIGPSLAVQFDSKSRVSPSACSSTTTVESPLHSLHPRHRRPWPVAMFDDEDIPTLRTSPEQGVHGGPSTAAQSSLLTPLQNVPSLEDRASALRRAAFRHRDIKSEDAYVDHASESSGSDVSEEWCATSDDESDVSEDSIYADEVVNDDMEFINDEDLMNLDYNDNTRDSTADNAEPPEMPASRVLDTRPSWNDRRARRRLLRKRPRIETPPPRVGPSESLPALRLRKHKRLRVESSTELPTPGSTASAVPSLHIAPADMSSVPQEQVPSEPPVFPKPVPVKQGNIFSNGEYTFRFSRQIRNYAIPEKEYRETGGTVITHEQFESRDTGRCGEINVLWMLLFDPEWLANDDGWAKYRTRSP